MTHAVGDWCSLSCDGVEILISNFDVRCNVQRASNIRRIPKIPRNNEASFYILHVQSLRSNIGILVFSREADTNADVIFSLV